MSNFAAIIAYFVLNEVNSLDVMLQGPYCVYPLSKHRLYTVKIKLNCSANHEKFGYNPPNELVFDLSIY